MKSSVTVEGNRQAIENLESESSILDYLYFKYGTRIVVSTKMLSNLEICKSSILDGLEAFLVELIVNVDCVLKGRQHSLLNPEIISRSL